LIGNVVHQAVITVDEDGTQAAAATAVGMTITGLPPADPPTVFRADRPLAFVIRDGETGLLRFIGRVADPS